MRYSQCFICREWSWDTAVSYPNTQLCLPCYVDVLEVRQARGELGQAEPMVDQLREGPDQPETPLPFLQLDLFDA